MMGKCPLVSVVIPTYNRPIYLKRCIDSVLNQTHKNIEIIVVDDNNPNTAAREETEKLMGEYQHIKSIYYYQHEHNKNGSAARNTGWQHANGMFITFLDDDDVIHPTKIEKQVACLEGLDASWGACYTAYELIKEHGTNQVSLERRSGNCYLDALMRTLFMGSGSNLLLRKAVVDEVQGYDASFIRNQDIEFLARVLEHYKLAYVDELLLTIYQEGNRTKRSLEKVEEINKHYLSKFSDRINALADSDKERVLAVITLERFRMYLYAKRLSEGLRLLKENNVKLKYIFRYVKYLLHRVSTHQSYGFTGK